MKSGKNPPPMSACEHLITILNLTEHPSRFFATKPDYPHKILQLKRAKTACILDMVVDPRSTQITGTLFLSRPQYETLVDEEALSKDTHGKNFKA